MRPPRPRLRPRTLRGRLIVGLLVLLAVASAAVGVATTAALNSFLMGRLDEALVQTGTRYAQSLEHGSVEPGDTRAQADGTFGARLLDGQVTQTGVVDGDGDDFDDSASGHGRDGDDRVRLTAADRAALAALPADGDCRTVRISALGPYRMRKLPGRDGDQLVTGLRLASVEDTVHRLVAVEAVVFGCMLIAAGVGGGLWVRAALRPLRRVAATAERVTRLPLASGEVTVPQTAVEDEADPESEVGRLSSSFNRMLGHVEDALGRRHRVEERLRRFAADAGHELRTPLAAIRGHAELAGARLDERRAELRDPVVERALERIRSESERMGAIVEDLLLLARLDAGRPLEREPVDLTVLAIDAAADARAAGREHRWVLELPEEPVVVTGDQGRLHQLVANLLANAARHTPAGTRVTVSVAAPVDGGPVELVVRDEGPGIPEEMQPAIFDRFTRVDGGRARAAGARGWGWRSPARWRRRTGAPSTSAPARAAPPSRCGCRGRTVGLTPIRGANEGRGEFRGPPRTESQSAAAAGSQPGGRNPGVATECGAVGRGPCCSPRP